MSTEGDHHSATLSEIVEHAETYKDVLEQKGEFSLSKIYNAIQKIIDTEDEADKLKGTVSFVKAMEIYGESLASSLEAKISDTLNKGMDDKIKQIKEIQEKMREAGIKRGGATLKSNELENYLGALFGLAMFGKDWYDSAISELEDGDDSKIAHANQIFQGVYLENAAAAMGVEKDKLMENILALIAQGKLLRTGDASGDGAWEVILDSIKRGYSGRHQGKMMGRLYGHDPHKQQKVKDYLLHSHEVHHYMENLPEPGEDRYELHTENVASTKLPDLVNSFLKGEYKPFVKDTKSTEKVTLYDKE